jgi:hypothetical protein
MTKYLVASLPFPLQSQVVVKDWLDVWTRRADRTSFEFKFEGGWFPWIAERSADEVVAELRSRWSAFTTPYLQKLSAAILERPLSQFSFDTQGGQWLTFEKSGSAPLHVAPPQTLTAELRTMFPFERIPGLAEFQEHFGGLVDGQVPPCPWFCPVDDSRVVAADCKVYDWGLVGDWAGALTLYNTKGGNFLVLSPENRCAKWDHDIGWERQDENPFTPLSWTMSDLVDAFLEYVAAYDLTQDHGPLAVEESPFYY